MRTLPLSVGALTYLLLCVPAMWQRGYPPIDRAWDGVTYLWPLPIVLSTMTSPPGRQSKRALALYAFGTAIIGSAAIVHMVPNHFDLLLILIDAAWKWIPIHLAITVALAWIGRRLTPVPERKRLIAITVTALLIVVIATSFPFLYRTLELSREYRNGRLRADANWADPDASFIFDDTRSDYAYKDCLISNSFDPVTGLQIRAPHGLPWESGYSDRLHELIHEHGLPASSRKSLLLSDTELLAMLDAPAADAITKFPCQVAPGILIVRGTPPNDFEITSVSSSSSLSEGSGAISIERPPSHPGTICIRRGISVVAVYALDGTMLQWISRQ